MESMLRKMAAQLDAIDEASLLDLWDKYAQIVAHFEPTKRWEESVLIFSFIQAKHWKNQLFNHNWAASIRPNTPPPSVPDSQRDPLLSGKVLMFPPRNTSKNT